MIKPCKAYKLTCDACGRQIGGIFARKDIAYGAALPKPNLNNQCE